MIRSFVGAAVAALVLGSGPGASAGSPAPCSGAEATLDCLERSLDARKRLPEERFWAILRAATPSAAELGANPKSLRFMRFARPRGNAELDEYLGEAVEKLCLAAPERFRAATRHLEPAAQESVCRMLHEPVTERYEEIERARCMASRNAAGAVPRGGQNAFRSPDRSGARAAVEHLARTDFEGEGDRFGLVRPDPCSDDPTGDVAFQCPAQRSVVVSAYRVGDVRVDGGSGVAAVHYRRMGSVEQHALTLREPHEEVVNLRLVHREGQWWIATPIVPRVSAQALLTCHDEHLRDLDRAWLAHASAEQRRFASTMEGNIALLRKALRESRPAK